MRTSKNGQKGVTLVTTTLMLVAFIGIAALAIDTGMLYSARTSAQHAADAAALAGAYEFRNPCYSDTPPVGCGAFDIHLAAFNAGQRTAAQNKIFGEPVMIGTQRDASPCPSADLATWICVDETNQRVTANVARSGGLGIVTYFARIFGSNTANVSAIATAEAGIAGAPTGTSSHCLKPIFIPNTVLARNADGTPVPVQTACNAGQVIFDPNQSPPQPTSWAQSQFSSGMYPKVIVRNGDPHKAADVLAPSQYYSLDFGSGASTYQCALAQCLNTCGVPDLISCSNNVNTLNTENGRMTQATITGIDNLIAPGGSTPDSWINGSSPSEFQLGDGTTGPTSKSLAVAAVWNNCTTGPYSGSGTQYAGASIGPGKESVPVIGFIQVFFDGVTQKSAGTTGGGSTYAEVTAHILPPIACGEVEGGGPPPAGPMTIPIRLVQSPAAAQ